MRRVRGECGIAGDFLRRLTLLARAGKAAVEEKSRLAVLLGDRQPAAWRIAVNHDRALHETLSHGVRAGLQRIVPTPGA